MRSRLPRSPHDSVKKLSSLKTTSALTEVVFAQDNSLCREIKFLVLHMKCIHS
ncbi:unnamed protein product [Lupinus luteus]|uniref:Uncharacterized protein n=1 Tax=Lupinus luteus TaxID=3873 RepID=A0AAV1Y7X5_LUPLU